MRAGLRALQERDEAVAHWLRGEVALVYDAVKAGKTKTRQVGDVFDEILARHAASQEET